MDTIVLQGRPSAQRFWAFFVTVAVSSVSMAHGQLIVAHRGASHDAPENTLAAFRLAFEQGADGIEGDFYLTRDGHIVCIHDADTKRVAGKKLPVADSSLAELKRLDVGNWKGAKWRGEQIPTIEEVLDVIPPDKMFFIELKVGPEIVIPLKEVLARWKLEPEQYVVISFREDTIAACEKQIPGVTTHWLSKHKKPAAGEPRDPTAETVISTLKESHADGFGSQAGIETFDAGFIRRLGDAGFRTFHVWTVDDAPTARFYQRNGALAITTNRPGYIHSVLERAPTSNGAGK